MKTTIVPAQVTTVEDKVAGNLTFTQLLLMTLPVFVCGALFILLPPKFQPTPLKLSLAVTISLVCIALAVRIKGKLLLGWLIIMTRYSVRPRHYLFNKNDMYLRHRSQTLQMPTDTKDEQTEEQVPSWLPGQRQLAERVRIEHAIADPQAKFRFKTEKGVLRVYIREIKKESI